MKKKTFIQQNSSSATEGMLKIFFSYASGSGSTTEMLEEIKELEQQGASTIISLRKHPATGEPFGEEFNLEDVLKRKPQYVAVDNLAVENPEGSRHRYRFKDVEELLEQGINVYATMQVGDLEGESDRFAHITGIESALTIPDRFFYDCNQLEFVDIDPKELVDRSKKRGVTQYSHAILAELRALALRCVAEYAAQSALEEGNKTKSHVLEEKVLALIFLDGRAGDLVHEAARIAEALDAPFEALYVESSPTGSVIARKNEETLARISELVESLDGTFVVLNGEDTIGVAADYIHAHGVTDVILARKHLSLGNRLVLPLSLPLDEKIAYRAPYVHIHTIPLFDISKKFRVLTPRLKKSAFQLSLRDLIFSIVVVAGASVLIGLLSNIGFSSQTSLLIYILAAALVARFTTGYTAGILASVGAILAMSYFFIRPYFSFAVDHKANYVTFVIMLAVSLIITTLATRMQRDSQRARYREQHTQVLYDLNRTLLFSRGIFDVVSTSLDTLTRLFGKPAIFYTDDPYVNGSSRSRGALMDTNLEIFKAPIEQEAARWAYLHNQPAGALTETFKIADCLYLPLSAGKEARGVIGVSMRTGEISQDDRTFLEMVATQISLALERQHLFDEHRNDLRAAELDTIRARFAEMVAGYAESSAQLISSATRKLLGLHGEETAEYHDNILVFLAHESHREKRFTESLDMVLSKRSDKTAAVDIHFLIQQAIKRAREDHPGVRIEFDNRMAQADVLLERATMVLALKHLLMYAASKTPEKKSVEVALKIHAQHIVITIADAREIQSSMLLDRVLSSRYILDREKNLRSRLEEETLDMSHTDVEDVEIDLVLASAGIKAHGGKVKSRRRLGGGMVTSVWLPR